MSQEIVYTCDRCGSKSTDIMDCNMMVKLHLSNMSSIIYDNICLECEDKIKRFMENC